MMIKTHTPYPQFMYCLPGLVYLQMLHTKEKGFIVKELATKCLKSCKTSLINYRHNAETISSNFVLTPKLLPIRDKFSQLTVEDGDLEYSGKYIVKIQRHICKR